MPSYKTYIYLEGSWCIEFGQITLISNISIDTAKELQVFMLNDVFCYERCLKMLLKKG